MKGRLLIVEDEPGIRNLLAQLFRAEGYETDVAVDGEEAIVYLQEAVYDIVDGCQHAGADRDRGIASSGPDRTTCPDDFNDGTR